MYQLHSTVLYLISCSIYFRVRSPVTQLPQSHVLNAETATCVLLRIPVCITATHDKPPCIQYTATYLAADRPHTRTTSVHAHICKSSATAAATSFNKTAHLPQTATRTHGEREKKLAFCEYQPHRTVIYITLHCIRIHLASAPPYADQGTFPMSGKNTPLPAYIQYLCSILSPRQSKPAVSDALEPLFHIAYVASGTLGHL
jgi:hypothetical protein